MITEIEVEGDKCYDIPVPDIEYGDEEYVSIDSITYNTVADCIIVTVNDADAIDGFWTTSFQCDGWDNGMINVPEGSGVGQPRTLEEAQSLPHTTLTEVLHASPHINIVPRTSVE